MRAIFAACVLIVFSFPRIRMWVWVFYVVHVYILFVVKEIFCMAVGNLPLDIRTRDIEVWLCVCMCVHRAGYCEHSHIFNIYQNKYAYLMAISGDGMDRTCSSSTVVSATSTSRPPPGPLPSSCYPHCTQFLSVYMFWRSRTYVYYHSLNRAFRRYLLPSLVVLYAHVVPNQTKGLFLGGHGIILLFAGSK